MARSVEDRISVMWNTRPSSSDQCAYVVWQSLGVPRIGAATAAQAGRIVRNAGHMNSGSPSSVPRGGVMFWSGGSSGDGHMALSLGGGKVLSTDVAGPASVGSVSAGWFADNWGALNWMGWSSWYGVPLPMAAGDAGSIPVDGEGNEVAGSAPNDGSIARITSGSVEWFHVAGWQPMGGGSGFVTDHDTPMMWLQDGFNICAFQDNSHGRENPILQSFTDVGTDVLACRIAPPRNRYRAPSLWWFVKEKVQVGESLTHFNLAVYQAKWKKNAQTHRAEFDRTWRTKSNRLGTIKGLTMQTGSTATAFVDRRRNDAYEVILSGIWAKVGGTQGASFVLTEGGFRIVGVVPTSPPIALMPPGGSTSMEMVGGGGGGTLPAKPGVQPRDSESYQAVLDGVTYQIGTVLGAGESGHTVIVNAYNWDSWPYEVGTFEVENLNGIVSEAAPVVAVLESSETGDVYTSNLRPVVQSTSGEVCWFARSDGGVYEWYLHVYRSGQVYRYPIGWGDVYYSIIAARVVSTGGYVHVVFENGDTYEERIACFSLSDGSERWQHQFQPEQGVWDYPWEATTDRWRTSYEYIAGINADKYIARNNSPDTVTVQAKINPPHGALPYLELDGSPNPYYPWPQYWYLPTYLNSVTWDVFIDETGETWVDGSLGSGSGLFASSSWGMDPVTHWWIEPEPPTNGYYSCAGYTSTEMAYAESDTYYDISYTIGWECSVSVEHCSHLGTGAFTITATTNAPWGIGNWTTDGFGLAINTHPYLGYSAVWDNTRFNGNRLELRSSTGSILDTLPFDNDEDAGFTTYVANKVFVGAALNNPWEGGEPPGDPTLEELSDPKFHWRTITVSGNSMDYGPVCSYRLPSHFTWHDLSGQGPEYGYDPVIQEVALGVWQGQVVVHAIGYSGCET